MDAIHRHVIFEVLKFIPYENARKLLTTHKSWLAPLTAQLEKQKKAITVEIERLEGSYQALRTLQIQCKYRYMDLEDQIKNAGSNLELQIYGRQTTIAPSQRHAQNVQSMNQLLQVFQNRRPDFDAASTELSDATAKVEALLLKLNGLKETLGIKVKKSAEERELAELEKAKQYHQVRYKWWIVLSCIGFFLYVTLLGFDTIYGYQPKLRALLYPKSTLFYKIGQSELSCPGHQLDMFPCQDYA
ncbi:hypothetical protein Ddc_19775 [Ditylenchus destructor]|nr:hypothetical protein Ddc_19775 [Ditylenchus destructor]